MIIVYETISATKLNSDVEELIKGAKAFFEKNPKRRVICLGVWYGQKLKAKRKTYETEIREYAKTVKVS